MLIDTPALALTGTGRTKMTDHLKKSLSMKNGTISIFVSPNREEIRLSVVKVKRETPKTIIFCNTMQDMASVLGYLLTGLGDYAMLLAKTKYRQTELWDFSTL